MDPINELKNALPYLRLGNIKVIAREFGVCITTVRRVLNGKSYDNQVLLNATKIAKKNKKEADEILNDLSEL